MTPSGAAARDGHTAIGPPADDIGRSAWLRALARTAPFAQGGGVPLSVTVEEMAASFPAQPALLGADGVLSYGDLNARMMRYARWALRETVEPGEVVGLLLPNCPDYVAVWLGITSVGGVVALINANLRGELLLAAIAAAAPTHLIVGATLVDAMEDLQARLPRPPRVWMHGPGGLGTRIDEHILAVSPEPLQAHERRQPVMRDLALHIYTSGTTGPPKAANISHRRIAEWSAWFAGMMDTQPGDRMYNCLPLYHSVGGVVAIGAMLVGGASVLIRPKFSATRFWDDIVENDCTVFQYIGELCRYLVNSPQSPSETQHRLRLCCGNGLRGDVWTVFQDRFRIPRILEFYASTEGNVSLYNCPGRPGAVGHVPAFLAHRSPVALLRCDAETGVLLRDADGRATRCGTDEIGEAFGRIGNSTTVPGRPFEGYADQAASEAKIARDVLAPGDAWFRTGDLLRRDTAGFYYFVDRLGDTFRWKGENVATEEVETMLRTCPGVRDVVVYGVTVPNMEGRAGMAALIVDERFDLAAFRRHIETSLPHYARPVFLRIGESIAATSTFKPARAVLAAEGYDAGIPRDVVYIADQALDAFVPLDDLTRRSLQGGHWRL